MKKPTRWPLILSLTGAFLVLAGVAAALIQEPWVQRFRRGNVKLTLAGATFGTFHPAPEWRWWQRLPGVQGTRPPIRTLNTVAPSASVWVHVRPDPNTPEYPIDTYFGATDLHGCRFPRIGSDHSMRSTQASSDSLMVKPNPVYPRRDAFFRYSAFDTRSHQSVGTFTVRNPGASAYPEWTPEPYPITRKVGRWGFGLAEIVRLPPGPRDTAAARLVVTDRGLPSDAWQPVGIEISDATGNRLQDRVQSYSADRLAPFQGLCFEEKAWKLDVQFGPSYPPRMPADLTWEVEVPNPAPREQLPLNSSYRSGGVVLRLVHVRHRGWFQDPSRRQILLRAQSRDGLQLALTEARNEAGRLLVSVGDPKNKRELIQNHPGGTREHGFYIRNAGSARRLRLKLQAYRLITASYLAEP